MNPDTLTIGDLAIVTCDNWFFAPDGKMYRAVFGRIKGVQTAEDTLGVRPNGKSTNWYIEIGNMTIAGCQVHYVMKTDTCDFGDMEQWGVHKGRAIVSMVPTNIYNATEA